VSTSCDTLGGVVDDQEVARRSDDPLDVHFAANMSRLREAAGVSQAELVQKLRDSGWTNVHPTTISRIEKRERPVRLSEAARIADVLGHNLNHMLARPDRAGVEEELDIAIERVTDCYNRIGQSVYWLIMNRNVLRMRLGEFRAVVDRDNDERLRDKLTESEPYLGLRVDNAVTAGREAYDAFAAGNFRGDDFLDHYGVSPYKSPDFVDEEDINAPEA
jgi:transcriptional regulator with XRE-family HTH domain